MKYLMDLTIFGIDIGGTLTKVVYFEPYEESIKNVDENVKKFLSSIKYHLLGSRAYGSDGLRDEQLQIDNVLISNKKGSLHFIRFPTNRMSAFINFVKEKKLSAYSSTVCATGGGAHKFQELFEKELHLKLHKFDELYSVVNGIQRIELLREKSEFFYFVDPSDPESELAYNGTSMKKTTDNEDGSNPFLVVNIGSGVSILSVQNNGDYRRICGTSIGGGTFMGLARQLTGSETFEEAMRLADNGDNENIDKLVKHIYGGDYTEFNLSGDIVASSFGLLNTKERCENAKKEDLAKSLLVTITNNIGSLALLCANAEKANRIIFVGNFLRVNRLSMRMLACAMEFWSNKTKRAYFCKHEGYFGALGCLLKLTEENVET